jgi:hypothetical protein
LRGHEFKASSGGLTSVKEGYDIPEIAVQGEHLSANEPAPHHFHGILEVSAKIKPEILSNLQRQSVWIILGRCLYPRKNPCFLKEKCVPGHKRSKGHFTLTFCANKYRTHKMEIVVILKTKKLECLKGVEAKGFPVKEARLEKDIFGSQFHKKFVPEDQYLLKEKALIQKLKLHMDIAPPHPSLPTMASS